MSSEFIEVAPSNLIFIDNEWELIHCVGHDTENFSVFKFVNGDGDDIIFKVIKDMSPQVRHMLMTELPIFNNDLWRLHGKGAAQAEIIQYVQGAMQCLIGEYRPYLLSVKYKNMEIFNGDETFVGPIVDDVWDSGFVKCRLCGYGMDLQNRMYVAEYRSNGFKWKFDDWVHKACPVLDGKYTSLYITKSLL